MSQSLDFLLEDESCTYTLNQIVKELVLSGTFQTYRRSVRLSTSDRLFSKFLVSGAEQVNLTTNANYDSRTLARLSQNRNPGLQKWAIFIAPQPQTND